MRWLNRMIKLKFTFKYIKGTLVTLSTLYQEPKYAFNLKILKTVEPFKK